MDKKLIGQYLIDNKLVSKDQLQRALELQALQLGTNTPLIGTILVQMGALKEQDVTSALEQQHHDAQLA